VTNLYNEFSPKFYELENRFVTDRCIWCFENNKLSKTHFIPESMGGRLKPYISCEQCNNYLGTSVESKVHENLYFAAAISKLKLNNKKNHILRLI